MDNERSDAAYAFTENAVKTRYEDIPAEVAQAAKRLVLDHCGVAVAGSTLPGAREVAELVIEGGGKPEATVLAYGGKVPSWMAAFANGGMAHVRDYDDCHDASLIHAGAPVIPAAFAMAQRLGNVNGKDFITAVVLGTDVLCRMAAATNQMGGWMLTQVDGFFGAAIAAGKLLKLDDAKMLNAFGIAYAQACGGRQTTEDGAQRKHLFGGLPAKGGIIAALLAQKGVTGARNSLEGKFGLYNSYHRGDYNREILLSALGKRFEGASVSFKPYPCCRTTHSYVDAAFQLMRECKIPAADIAEVVVSVSDFSQALCRPLEVKQNPPTTVQAQYSIPYTVADAIIRGEIKIEDFTPEKIKDEAVLAISRKVKPRLDQELNRRGLNPAVVEIKLKSGASHSRRVEYPSGHPSKPMSDEQLVGKFKDCLGYSVRPIPGRNAEKVIAMVKDLEQIKNVGEVIELLG